MLMDIQTALLDLLHELHGTEVKLIIGGGYGIYLRVEHVRMSGMVPLFHEWPEARSTNDLDLFLRPELLIESEMLRPLSDALNNLGYRAIPSAAKYQFIKITENGNLKIDILTGPEHCFRGTKVRTDSRRVKPNPSIGIHAHPTDEALTLEENLLGKTVSGTLSTGAAYDAAVYLPH